MGDERELFLTQVSCAFHYDDVTYSHCLLVWHWQLHLLLRHGGGPYSQVKIGEILDMFDDRATRQVKC
jgi:hypothetical protein